MDTRHIHRELQDLRRIVDAMGVMEVRAVPVTQKQLDGIYEKMEDLEQQISQIRDMLAVLIRAQNE